MTRESVQKKKKERKKKPFHFAIEQMVIWPLAVLDKANLENKTSLIILVPFASVEV